MDVFVRVRPVSSEEAAAGREVRVHALEDGKSVSLRDARTTETYEFDGVFGPESTADDVFSRALSAQVEQACRGVPSCTFAYGQTGSGKTWTAFGEGARERGLVPRAAASLFAGLDERYGRGKEALAQRLNLTMSDARPFVRISMVQVHNEELSDLLFPLGSTATPPNADDASEPIVIPFADAIGVIRADVAKENAAAAARAAKEDRAAAKAAAGPPPPPGSPLSLALARESRMEALLHASPRPVSRDSSRHSSAASRSSKSSASDKRSDGATSRRK